MKDMMAEDPAAALTTLGFTQIESLLYYELLKNSPATGYRLAQQVGKAPANIYQSLKTLTQKGVILTNQGLDEAASYIPVPPAELLASLGQAYAERQERARAMLEQVRQPATDVIVSQLRTVTQVFERARAMLAGAREVIIFDCMPEVLVMLREEIDAAKARGVEVGGLAYRPEDAAEGVPYAAKAAEGIGSRWPGFGLILVVDGSEQLIALLTRDFGGVVNAVYSDSIFLCCILHNTLTADIRLTALRNDMMQPDKALHILDRRPPGLRHMIALARAQTEEGPNGG